MKAVLVFLFLLAFVACETVEEVKERFKKNPQELEDVLNNCILNSETASEDLKSKVVKNKDRKPGKKIPLVPYDKYKVNPTDKEVVKKCRVKQFHYIKKQFKKAIKASKSN
jgi:hypothetical protein